MTDDHAAPHEPDGDLELFIEFANTLAFTDGVPEDRVPDADALLAWLEARHLAGAATRTGVARTLTDFQSLRELIHDITGRIAADEPPTATHLRRLNRVLRDGLHYHQLSASRDGARFTVGQVGDDLDQARAAIAQSLAHYVADHDIDRLRICANDGCRWRFIDRSRAARRRWCDMTVCGNRAKVARHRARARERSTAGRSDGTR